MSRTAHPSVWRCSPCATKAITSSAWFSDMGSTSEIKTPAGSFLPELLFRQKLVFRLH